ncbi:MULTISPECIES: FHA domain-containing protein [unclassified Leucobacter]|uniref:FHA domain-containing protein n=1 Tax=unclassified Leucobacter TaxID=2621730 RepID=UPI00301A9FD6
MTRGDELCRSCGLDMQRLLGHTPRTVAETLDPRPVAVAPPAAGGKKRRKRRASKRAAAAAPHWVDGTPASNAAVSALTALPVAQQPAVAPPVVVAPPAVATPQVVDVADELDEATLFRRPAEVDIVNDATIVAAAWVLEFPDGATVSLPSPHVVVGRRPQATEDATLVSLPDPSRSLSRTHARLRRDMATDTWTIEDLGSSNGVATVSDTGEATWLTSGVPAAATEYLLLGDVQARLTKVATRDTARALSTATPVAVTASPDGVE